MTKRKSYIPVLKQEGKDCPWEPSSDEIVDLMLKIGKITPNDVVMDLGSGDGKIPIAAAKFGAFGVGVEYNHDLVLYSRKQAKKNGVSDKTKFIESDIYNADLSEATIITLYLWPEIMEKMYPVLSKLKPGTRIVSHLWSFENWEPDFKLSLGKENRISLWILPKI